MKILLSIYKIFLLPIEVTNKYPIFFFTIMRDANLIKIMIEEPASVKLIKTIGEKE